MSIKNTSDIIDDLSKNLKNYNKNFSPLYYSVFVMLFILIFQVIIMNARLPFVFNQLTLNLIFDLALGSVAVFSFVFLGFKALVPGSNRIIPFAMGALALVALLVSSFFNKVNSNLSHQIRAHCELEAMILAIFTVSVLHFIIKRFPLFDFQVWPKVIFLVAPLVVTLILHASCSVELSHVLSCHVMPAMAPGAMYLLVRRFLANK